MSPRGGHHQKRRKRDDFQDASSILEGQSVEHSPLWLALMNKWAWGVLSAPGVQELAIAAYQTGCSASDVKVLAHLGSAGAQQGNIHRDLLRQYCSDTLSPDPVPIQVPMQLKDEASGEFVVQVHDCHIFLPHDWWASLDGTDHIREALGQDGLKDFWANVSESNPKLHDSPFADVQDKHNYVPLLVHGDGGQFQSRDSLFIISMRSILSTLPVLMSMFLLAAVPKKCRAKSTAGDTVQMVWKWLAWSFAAMYAGIHPLVDADGKDWPIGSQRKQLSGTPLCPRSGLKAIIWVLGGDYDYLSNELGLKHHGSNEPCSYCDCNVTNKPWNDFRPGAIWKTGVKTVQQTRANCPTNHVIMSVPGVVFETIHLDTMHLLELGILLHQAGNILADIVYDHLPGSKQAATQSLNRLIASIYSDLKTPSDRRVPQLEIQNICASRLQFPCLLGVKAREARYFVPVLLQLCEKFQTEDVYTKHRTACMAELVRIYEVVDAHAFHVPPEDVQKLRVATDRYLLHYSWLAKYSMQRKWMRWSLVPKFHYLWHLSDQVAHLSPRASWSYCGESLVGAICALGQACSAGTASHKLSKGLTAKYRIAMHLLFSGQINCNADDP